MYTCPITLQPVQEPVLAADGIIYERAEISKWFESGKRTSPVSRQPLVHLNLTPVFGLSGSSAPPPPPPSSSVNIYEGRHNTILATGEPLPVFIVLVIDVSGSMNTDSNLNNGSKESSAFTRLELVKHSALTVIEMLSPDDFFAVITFSDSAKLILPTSKLHPTHKQIAKEKINSICTQGSTNLAAGISLAYDLPFPDSNIHKNVICLTDGEPNQDPMRGYDHFMKEQLISNRTSLHMCGFGCSLDTPLLWKFAEEKNGIFNFIPDGSMVGTVFIHFITIIKTTLFYSLELYDAFGTKQNVTFIRNGIPFSFLPLASSITKVIELDRHIPFTLQQQQQGHSFDFNFTPFLKKSIDIALKKSPIDAFNMITSYSTDDPLLAADIKDDSSERGQISKAFQHFSSWGFHYLVAIYFAHSRQIKINFKDQSLTAYSSPEFEALISLGEKTFSSIPPPQTTILRAQTRGTVVPSMSSMVTASAGCFGENTQIQLIDDSFLPITHLKRGMILKNGAKVILIVEYSTKETPVFQVSPHLFLTAWHPFATSILNQKRIWQFPIQVKDLNLSLSSTVYNIQLDQLHVIPFPDGIQAVTLGHGFQEDLVKHPYFGTQKCIQDIQQLPEKDGKHIITYFFRDVQTNLISRLI